ncbi:MAG: hypothetical protein WC518_01775 [Patescibacteria group bacterium]
MPDAFSTNFNRFLDDGLKIVANCPVCHYHYNPGEAKVLEENEGAHLIYLKCRRCYSAILVLIMANNFGISSVGLITDLDSHEVMKFKAAKETNSDDVLSVHQLLENNSSGWFG